MIQKYRLLMILYLMPLLECIIALPFMNSVVPVHYTNAVMDRWGSKYEYLLIAVMLTAAGLLFLFFLSKLRNVEQKENNRVLMIFGYLAAAVFNYLMIMFLWHAAVLS